MQTAQKGFAPLNPTRSKNAGGNAGRNGYDEKQSYGKGQDHSGLERTASDISAFLSSIELKEQDSRTGKRDSELERLHREDEQRRLDREREREAERRKQQNLREAEEAVKLAHKDADERKERIEKQAAELIVTKQKVFEKKDEINKMYAEEVEYIRKKAAAMSEDTRKRCAETYSDRDHKLKADCLAKVTAHNYIILSLIGYGILSTVLSVIIMAQYLQ